MVQTLSFAAPWALTGLLALPVIWWLLRFSPPAPEHVKFPPLRLLLDLVSREEEPDRTPWWLLALRLSIAALVIFAMALPFLGIPPNLAGRDRPLLILVDNSWAAADTFAARQELMLSLTQGRALVSVVPTVSALRPASLAAEPPDAAEIRIRALEAMALAPDRLALLQRLQAQYTSDSAPDIAWISDGLDHGSALPFATGLLALGGGARLDVYADDPARLPLALSSVSLEDGRMVVKALRAAAGPEMKTTARAVAGNGRTLGEATFAFGAGATQGEGAIDLPVELRNEAQRIELSPRRSAAEVFLLDDGWRRKSVALVAGASGATGPALLSPLLYVSRALEPFVDLVEPPDTSALKDSLKQGVSMLVLADVGTLDGDALEAVRTWVEGGGLLVRFAGPRFAGGQDELVPAPIRGGGRDLGGSLSWETAQALHDFSRTSPFADLPVDPDVRVSRQVLAEPDANLPDKVWATLADGTPLITARRAGKGTIVLFHVTANAEWSNLPLSGLFVTMLRRLVDMAPATGGGDATAPAAANTATPFQPERILTGRGDLVAPPADLGSVAATLFMAGAVTGPADGAKAGAGVPTPAHPAGLYRRGGALRAINLLAGETTLALAPALPSGATVHRFEQSGIVRLWPLALLLALGLFLVDWVVALSLGGAWRRLVRRAAPVLVLALLLGAVHPDVSRAETTAAVPGDATAESFAIDNATVTRLAWVITGDAETDAASKAGLEGLTLVVKSRTSLEPGPPQGVDLERDELVFFPLIYWPIVPGAEPPSDQVVAKLNAYMKNGGTLFFDLREEGDGLNAMTSEPTPATQTLRRLLSRLDIPALEPVPSTHVLTKTFYLLQDFPGRYQGGALWLERAGASEADSSNADGVSSVIIGSNDYAAAWALDANGQPLYATIPADEMQREFAWRAGVNIVMYALTGNYKADQVHVPALLERLGQ